MTVNNLTIKLNEYGEVSFDLFDMIKYLPEEKQSEVAEFLGWDMILEHLDNHLKRNSTYDSWDTSGYRGGSKIREHIEKVQGTRDQRIEDLLDRIKALEHAEKNYKQYYDWYFKFYHYDYDLHGKILKSIGDPKESK